MTIVDALHQTASRCHDRTFLQWEGGTRTYGEMVEAVDDVARQWAEVGVRRGDRVVLLVESKPTFICAWLGLAAAGGVAVAVNPAVKPAELVNVLELIDPAIVVLDNCERYRSSFDPNYDVSCPVVLIRESPESVSLVAIGGCAPGSRADSGSATRVPSGSDVASDRDLVSIIYTSGSTGRPKGVMHSHRTYVLTGQAFASWLQLDQNDCLYLCLPLFHLNAQAYTVMGAIAAGARIVAVPRFSASRFWSDMCKYEVTEFNFVGAMLSRLIQQKSDPGERQHGVRIAYGAPAMPHREEIERRFGLRIICGYGLTETPFGLIESLAGERRNGSMGKPRCHPDPLITCEAKIACCSEGGVKSDQRGELLLRNPALMVGYFRNAVATADAIRDGWLQTGDVVERDEDGFFYFVGRRAGMIRRRGENVAALEIERVLETSASVSEVSVFGVPSDLSEEEILAIVVWKAGCSADLAELIEMCASALSAFKVPRYWHVVEALPNTATHKVDLQAVRKHVAAAGTWFDREANASVEIPETLRLQLAAA